MKKILIILIMALFITSCSIFQEKKEDTKANLEGQIKVSQLQKGDAKVQKIVEDFALAFGQTKADVKKGQVRIYDETTETSLFQDGFQLTNEHFLAKDYPKIMQAFESWKILMPADGIAESFAWYLKDDIVCSLYIKLNATAEEIDNDDIDGKDELVEIACGKNPLPKKSDNQRIVENFASLLGKTKKDVKTTTFDWETEDGAKEIEGFGVENENYSDIDGGYVKFFDTWEIDDNNVADGPGAGVMGYKKDNIVCLVSDSINATIEQIQTEDNLSKYSATVEVSCGEYTKNKNTTKLQIGDKGKASDLQDILGFQIGNGELENMNYDISAVKNNYLEFGIQGEVRGFLLVAKKVGDKYEKVWEGQDVSDSDCEILEEKYNDIFTYENFPFSDCLARLEKFIPTKENLEKVAILRSALKNFEIKDIDGAVPSNFLWKQNGEEYIVDGYKISFKKFEKTFEFDEFGWKEDTENATTQEKLVIRGFEKDNEVCLVEYYIREGNSDIWAYADTTLSCGKFNENNKVNQAEKCQNYIRDVFYTSKETESYINTLNEQKAKNRESDVGLIDYVFEGEKLELSDGFYYAIKEIHRDSKDSETREVTTRHYKHDGGLGFYEYDIISDNYKKLTTEEKYVDLYKKNCVK